MYDFEYVRARSVDHALEVLAEHEDEATVIAGGQSLLNILKQGLLAPEYLLDVKGLDELDYVRFDEEKGFALGATATHRTLEKHPDVLARCPVMAEMERHLASVQVRNWGTLGGTLCIADPTSDVAPVFAALGCEVTLRKAGGERAVDIGDFFVDYYETVREDDELLTEIRVALPGPSAGVAYEKFRNVEGDAPIVVASAWVALEEDGRTCRDLRLVLGGVASTPVRSSACEDALRGRALDEEALREAAALTEGDIAPIPDIVASPGYKKKIAAVLARRTLARAAASAQGGRS